MALRCVLSRLIERAWWQGSIRRGAVTKVAQLPGGFARARVQICDVPSAARIDVRQVVVHGDDLAPGNPTADFGWLPGPGPGEVQRTNGGGFVAVGQDRTLDFGGNAAPIFFESDIGQNFGLFLSHPGADATLNLANPIILSGTGTRSFAVPDGAAAIDARLLAPVQSSSPDAAFAKSWPGTPALAADLEHIGPTFINNGTLLLEEGVFIAGP